MVYDESNIQHEFDNCVECLKPCYKIVDCVTASEYKPMPQGDISKYDGRIVSWIDPADPETFFCGTIVPFECREEEVEETEWEIISCFKECSECLPIVTKEPEFSRPKQRAVKPGYTVPTCDQPDDCC